MSVCDSLIAGATAGAAPALRAVDCMASETASATFGRLFGTNGTLLPALTIILTLYIGFFAVSLLTGRSRIGISALTPRMMTLGLVLTFATSWAAYQGVVWTLATGAPDQIAGVLLGARGSATQLFADRIDLVFAAIADAAGAAAPAAEGGVGPAAAGSFTPGNLMWIAALMLLLGTVGVLVTARIALAVLLALGPIFVVFALFSGTRGLFAGWLRGVVMTALTPLFAVLGGGFMLELAVPVVSALQGDQGIDGRAALALFMVASIHLALMALVLKVSGTMVGAWQVFGLAQSAEPAAASAGATGAALPAAASAYTPVSAAGTPAAAAPRRAVFTMAAQTAIAAAPAPVTGGAHGGRTRLIQSPAAPSGLPPLAPRRARGIGSRFGAARPAPRKEMFR